MPTAIYYKGVISMNTPLPLTEVPSVLEDAMSAVTDLPDKPQEISEYLKKLLDMLEEFAVTYGGKLIIALLILIIGFKVVNSIVKKLGGSKAFSRFDASAKSFVQNAISIVIKVIIAITALSIMGIPMTSMITVIGSCGLAIGLALQGSLANIAGGFILLILKPFKDGDYVVTSGIEGTIENIGIFHTKLITLDNRRIVIPNSVISNATLTNVSALEERRVDLTFNAAYKHDINTVEKILKETCASHDKVLKDHDIFARLSAHNDCALEYTVRVWCKKEDYWDVYFDLIRDVKYAFDKNNISIPFPQTDVHLDK